MRKYTGTSQRIVRLCSWKTVGMTVVVAGLVVVPGFASASTARHHQSNGKKYTLKYFRHRLKVEERRPTYTGPKSSPKPQSGKHIFVIECAAANTGCVHLANSVVKSDNAVGWQTTLMDGKGSTSTVNADMLTALNQGADGIVLDAINGSTVLQGMEQAKKDNVPVISANADSKVGNAVGDVYAEISDQSIQSGRDLADLFIVRSKGHAKVAAFYVSAIQSTVNRHKGFIKEMKKCRGCKVVSDKTYGIVSQATFEGLIKATVAAHPDIQYIYVGISQYATIAATALQQMGLQHKIGVAGIDCLPPETQSILHRTGEIGCAEDSLPNVGPPATNEFIRAFAGLPHLNESEPLRLLTRKQIKGYKYPYLQGFHLLPFYKKIWGLS